MSRPGMWSLPVPGSPGPWGPGLCLCPLALRHFFGTLFPTVVRNCLLFGLMICFADLIVIAEPKGEGGTGFSWKNLAQRWNWKKQIGFQCPKVLAHRPQLVQAKRVVKTSPTNPVEGQVTILTNLYSKSQFRTMDCPHSGRLWLLSQEWEQRIST